MSRPLCRLVNSSLWDPSTLRTRILTLRGIRPLCGLESWPFVGFVHFMDLFKFSTLVGSVHVVDLFKFFYPCWVRPRCGLEFWPFVGSVYFVDSFKFSTLVGSVHVVDWCLDPSWGPSTLWTCLSFLPLSLGPSTLWTGVLTLHGIHPLCGLI